METKEIVRQIELRLVELGIKKGDFYKLTGVSSSSFSQWNTGIAQPSRDALHRIDAVLGTSLKKKTPQIDRAAIQRKLDRLKDLYVDGDIDKDKYKEERDKLTPLLEVKESRPRKPTVVIGNDFLQHYSALSRQQKQEFWRNIIDKIVVDKSKNVSIFLR